MESVVQDVGYRNQDDFAHVFLILAIHNWELKKKQRRTMLPLYQCSQSEWLYTVLEEAYTVTPRVEDHSCN